MDSKALSKLQAIEDNTEQLHRIEQLLEAIVESNRRSEKYLEQMWRMYQRMSGPTDTTFLS